MSVCLNNQQPRLAHYFCKGDKHRVVKSLERRKRCGAFLTEDGLQDLAIGVPVLVY
jgi:hypothetical protein